ncbi:MAG: phosphoribosylglycinamide formyltransferase [Candidatus Bathyarchaeia archaeon]
MTSSETVRLGVLVSGRGTNLQAIIDAVETGYIKGAKVAVVISDVKEAHALERARKHKIPALFIDPKRFRSRIDFDEEVIRRLDGYGVDLVLLAGYMRIVSPEFVEHYKWRMMNIHPALLPSFPGLNAQKQALEHGVKVSGATVHFVTEDVDAGPIILQRAVPVMEDDTVESLSERILEQEHKIYPEAVRLFVEGRLKVVGRRVKIIPKKLTNRKQLRAF